MLHHLSPRLFQRILCKSATYIKGRDHQICKQMKLDWGLSYEDLAESLTFCYRFQVHLLCAPGYLEFSSCDYWNCLWPRTESLHLLFLWFIVILSDIRWQGRWILKGMAKSVSTRNSILIPGCCFSDPSSMNEKKRRDREERQNIVLWRQPLTTLQYFSLEVLIILKEWTSK